jgi:hypothetical protein
MRQELRDPLRVTHIRLAARDRLAVCGIEQPEREGACEQLADGLPVLESTREYSPVLSRPTWLQPPFAQPVGAAQQLAGGGAKGLDLAHPRAGVVACQAADHYRALMDVNASAAVEDNLPALPPPPQYRARTPQGHRRDTAGTPLLCSISPTRSHSRPHVRHVRQQLLVLAGVRALLVTRLDAPSYLSTSARLPLPGSLPHFHPCG